MGMKFTEEQQATVDARGTSVLVSAAAGSGKTAVLVERIIKMVSDRENPVDIDRLLVVTFTHAAASQMRERITQALSAAMEASPDSGHLARQLTLVHNAQITTIDSFCLYLIRNHFDEIGLDPDFRVADEGEMRLLGQEVLDGMLEEYFAAGDEDFLACVEYFAPTGNEKRLEEQILGLYQFAMSYPWPLEWLEMHKRDYQVSADSLENCDWVRTLKEYVKNMLAEVEKILQEAGKLCQEADGPYMYLDALEADGAQLARLQAADSLQEFYEGFQALAFPRISSKKDPEVSPEKRERAKTLRDSQKTLLGDLAKKYFYAPPESQAARMAECAPRVAGLLELTEDYCRRFEEKRREKHLLDFHDMEHLALAILTRRENGQVVPTRTAREMREFYKEIMIDEYQDSNLVQEYLLASISGEETGRYNRFMVGDVKQSIYKFRLARPELFMEKFERYQETVLPGEKAAERRIDLKKNFRSRPQVTESVNDVFLRIMGKDLGGVEYDENAALYPGAVFPEPSCEQEDDADYETEFLLTQAGEDGLEDKEREALAVAGRIRALVGRLPVRDSRTGDLRPARYGDMVILLRTTSGWDEVFKNTLASCGIPAYITSKTGYFAAPEVQTVLNFLRVLNNPLQDIPLFGVLHSRIGNFTDRQIALLRAAGQEENQEKKEKLYQSLVRYARCGKEDDLRRKAGDFLEWLSKIRELTVFLPIHQLIEVILQETGYLYYVSALPGGEQRRANVEMLLARAENFEKTNYFGLFHFIRYMEQVEKYEIDYGEASLQDENADTVRIMSIHRSKGLEFPICFVSGLAKRFNMQDTTRPVIVDLDYGIGLDYVDSTRRVKRGTLKKNVLAGKLRRDSLGEELRVLYVAMTRAEEKLILTGNCKADKAEWLKEQMEEEKREENREKNKDASRRLSFALRAGASSYLDWLLPAWLDCGREVEILDASLLLAGEMKERQDGLQLQERLKGFRDETERSGEEEQELCCIRERMKEGYAHENLKLLYTKTTVSELKKAGMEETAGEAYHLFEQEEPAPYLPRFIRDEDKVSGTTRGSAYHKALELFDFGKWFSRGEKDRSRAHVESALDEMAKQGTLSEAFREAVNPARLADFLDSPLAERMGRAAKTGKLYKEQPFVLGLPASGLNPDFPEEETVLIQGIIDVYFEEEDGLVVADYKTDRVSEAQELVNRYQVQLDYYARALEQLTGKRVREKIIYSFALHTEVLLL